MFLLLLLLYTCVRYSRITEKRLYISRSQKHYQSNAQNKKEIIQPLCCNGIKKAIENGNFRRPNNIFALQRYDKFFKCKTFWKKNFIFAGKKMSEP
jgi:hypothetical protein